MSWTFRKAFHIVNLSLDQSEKNKKVSFFQPENVFYDKALWPGQLCQKASPTAAHFPLYQEDVDISKRSLFTPGQRGFLRPEPFPRMRPAEHVFGDCLCSQEWKLLWTWFVISRQKGGLYYSADVFFCICWSIRFFFFFFYSFHSFCQTWQELADRKRLWQQVLRIRCLPKTTCQDAKIRSKREKKRQREKNMLVA